MSSQSLQADKTEIDELAGRFFNLFANTNNRMPELSQIYSLFIARGLVIKNVGGHAEIFSLPEFIEPRQKMLTDGTLTNFGEQELTERTDIAGNIAQRLSTYKKYGTLNGHAFENQGVKTIQFVKINNQWKISCVAWDDF